MRVALFFVLLFCDFQVDVAATSNPRSGGGATSDCALHTCGIRKWDKTRHYFLLFKKFMYRDKN